MNQSRRFLMTVAIGANQVVNPGVIQVVVAHIPGGPPKDTLLICTGTVLCNFQGNNGVRRDTLEFPIPIDGLGNLLRINRIVPGGNIQNVAATASLASIYGGNTLAVDNVDFRLSDPEEGLFFLEVALAASDGNTINRIAYQVNIIIGPSRSIG
jgi:hypothetical protein